MYRHLLDMRQRCANGRAVFRVLGNQEADAIHRPDGLEHQPAFRQLRQIANQHEGDICFINGRNAELLHYASEYNDKNAGNELLIKLNLAKNI